MRGTAGITQENKSHGTAVLPFVLTGIIYEHHIC